MIIIHTKSGSSKNVEWRGVRETTYIANSAQGSPLDWIDSKASAVHITNDDQRIAELDQLRDWLSHAGFELKGGDVTYDTWDVLKGQLKLNLRLDEFIQASQTNQEQNSGLVNRVIEYLRENNIPLSKTLNDLNDRSTAENKVV